MTVAGTSVRETLSGLNRLSGRQLVGRVSDEPASVRLQPSSFSTPGFTPDLIPVLLPIPGPPPSHSITLVQGDLLYFQ